MQGESILKRAWPGTAMGGFAPEQDRLPNARLVDARGHAPGRNEIKSTRIGAGDPPKLKAKGLLNAIGKPCQPQHILFARDNAAEAGEVGAYTGDTNSRQAQRFTHKGDDLAGPQAFA